MQFVTNEEPGKIQIVTNMFTPDRKCAYKTVKDLREEIQRILGVSQVKMKAIGNTRFGLEIPDDVDLNKPYPPLCAPLNFVRRKFTWYVEIVREEEEKKEP